MFGPDALASTLADVPASHFSEQFVNWWIPICACAGLLFALYQVLLVSGIRVHSALLDDDTEALLGPAGDHDGARSRRVASCESPCGLLTSWRRPRRNRKERRAHPRRHQGGRAVVPQDGVSRHHQLLRAGAQSLKSAALSRLADPRRAQFAVFTFLLLGSGDAFSWKWKDDPQGVLRSPKVSLGLFSALSFSLGAVTSMICGYLGMMVGTYGNVRTAVEARRGMAPAFSAAYRSGSVMGFLLSSLALLMLFGAVHLYRLYFKDDWSSLFAAVAGYGLGGSSVALFGRVGGGVYTKAADVGADLVGKVERGIPEDDPRNPAVVADLVGDCVGDIAGMGADLFGSYAESSVSALVLASVSSLGANHQWSALMYPLMISSTSILVCIITTFIASDISPARSVRQIQPVLKSQLIISAVLMTAAMLPITLWTLPSEFTGIYLYDSARQCTNLKVYFCVVSGIVSALVIGLVTEYYTSFAYKPVREVAEACRTGAATNVIYGLALGYKSVVVPVLLLGSTVFAALELASFFGVACAALGMLATLATCLTIDAFGPISDNAGGIAEMSQMGEDVRERTDALDAAGNTTAAVGKGVAIGSAALVALALFGSYITQAGLQLADASILDSKVITGLLVGAVRARVMDIAACLRADASALFNTLLQMLPYLFSAMTVKAVGLAALKMVDEVRHQFRHIPGLMEGTARPDYDKCIAICTVASLHEMVAPGALVLLMPVVFGVFFGTHALAGLVRNRLALLQCDPFIASCTDALGGLQLAGSLVSGVQMAVSMANTGGAWDNVRARVMDIAALLRVLTQAQAKKYLESGATDHARSVGGKGSEAHKAAVVGDTIGDPLKDTSGPSACKLYGYRSLLAR